jgi:hypothetical protein
MKLGACDFYYYYYFLGGLRKKKIKLLRKIRPAGNFHDYWE